MIEEMVDFNQAVAAVVAWLEAQGRLEETLIVVTADHECGYLVPDGPAAGSARETTLRAGAALRARPRQRGAGSRWPTRSTPRAGLPGEQRTGRSVLRGRR